MNREEIIRKALSEGKTAKEIGRLIGGVSRQRVYQLMDRYGINTPEIKRHGFWKYQSPEMKWLQRTTNSKGIDRAVRLSIAEDLRDGFPTHCPVLGIPLVYGEKGIRTDNSASLDRTDCSKGYEVGNVKVISWRANRIKNNGTLEDFKKLVDYLS